MNIIYRPTAAMAKGLENLNIYYEKTGFIINKIALRSLAKIVSFSCFPLVLTLELIFKRVPKLLISCVLKNSEKMKNRFAKVQKFALAIISTPVSLFSETLVSSFFLKNPHKKNVLAPFGIENLFVDKEFCIAKPQTIEQLQQLVKEAILKNQKISVVGAGFSQGVQTVPSDKQTLVLSLEHINQIEFSEDHAIVKAGAGAIWENIQYKANLLKKSVIVKQASDPFSVGGSIAINCHGWAHKEGCISSVIEEIEVIDATGEIIKLKKGDERFGHYFGTLGYFGIIVSAKIQLTDNVELLASSETIKASDFSQVYEKNIQKGSIPLFYGRLALNSVDETPLQEVCLQKYETIQGKKPLITPGFYIEPKFGKAIEQIFIQAVSHLHDFFAKRLLKVFWMREKKMMAASVPLTRNEILHPPINVFKKLHHSHLHTQWLQEYFLTKESLGPFLEFLGKKLKDNHVRLVNASIRPVPKDTVSILP